MKRTHQSSPGRRSWRSERGAVAPMVAILLPLLIAALALGVDAAYLYAERVAMQSAADLASLAGAKDLPTSNANATAAAVANATANGYTNGVQGVSVGVVTPYSGDSSRIQVTIQRAMPTLFLPVLGRKTMDVGARAVAQNMVILPCVLCVLDPTASGALTTTGGAPLTVTGGGISINSTSSSALTTSSSGGITASQIGIVGGYVTSGGAPVNPTPIHGYPVPDPLASIPAPSSAGMTSYGNYHLSGGADTIQPGIYQGIAASGSSILTLSPGTYIITGSFNTTGSANIVGSGVTLYFTCGNATPTPCGSGDKGGQLSISGTGSYTVSGPTSGTYQGLPVFYDRNNAEKIDLSGGSGMNFTGTIYAKSALLNLSGGSGATQLQSLIITDSVNMSGSGTIKVAYQKSQNAAAGMAGLLE